MKKKLPDSLKEQTIDRGAILHSTMFEDIDHSSYINKMI